MVNIISFLLFYPIYLAILFYIHPPLRFSTLWTEFLRWATEQLVHCKVGCRSGFQLIMYLHILTTQLWHSQKRILYSDIALELIIKILYIRFLLWNFLYHFIFSSLLLFNIILWVFYVMKKNHCANEILVICPKIILHMW